jgi:hypothetical protein
VAEKPLSLYFGFRELDLVAGGQLAAKIRAGAPFDGTLVCACPSMNANLNAAHSAAVANMHAASSPIRISARSAPIATPDSPRPASCSKRLARSSGSGIVRTRSGTESGGAHLACFCPPDFSRFVL